VEPPPFPPPDSVRPTDIAQDEVWTDVPGDVANGLVKAVRLAGRASLGRFMSMFLSATAVRRCHRMDHVRVGPTVVGTTSATSTVKR
jgi:hypothetical protein